MNETPVIVVGDGASQIEVITEADRIRFHCPYCGEYSAWFQRVGGVQPAPLYHEPDCAFVAALERARAGKMN